MDQDFNLNVRINTGDAVQGLINIKSAADQAATSVGKVGESAQSAAQEVSKVGDAADKSIPKVQGLGSAFEGVFSTAVEMGSQAGGTLGDIFKSVNQAIPTVKQINNTAITGLRGVKAALASTGIGAFIVAIGVIISHWEGFLQAVGSSKEEFDTFKSKALDTLGNIVSGIVGVGNVIFQSLITPLRTVIVTVQGLGRVMGDVFSGQWGKIREDAQNALGAIKDVWEKGLDFSGNFQKGKEAGEKFVQGVVTTFTYKAPEIEKTGTDNLSGGSSGKGNAYRKAGEKAGKEFGKGLAQGADSMSKEVSSMVDKLLDEKELQAEIERVEKEVVPDLVQQLKGLTGNVDLDFNGKLFTEDVVKEIAKLELAYHKNLEAIRKEEEKGLLNSQTAKELRESLEKEHNEAIGSILEQRAGEYREEGEEELKYTQGQLKTLLELQYRREELEHQFDEDQLTSGGYWSVGKNKALEALQLDRLNSLKKYYQEMFKIETDPDKKQEILQDIQDVENQKTLIVLQASEERKKIRASEVATYADAANSIADIFGTVAAAEEERIQRELDAGDIGIEAAKSQFETVKQWQYAQTWINTVAGMTAALTAPSMQATGPAGWVAAATQAASLLATGIAQTIKIKNTQFNGGGVSSGGSGISASPSVTPIDVRNDIQQSPTVLPDSQSPRNQRVYILERDIQDSNRRVEVRENNSTF